MKSREEDWSECQQVLIYQNENNSNSSRTLYYVGYKEKSLEFSSYDYDYLYDSDKKKDNIWNKMIAADDFDVEGCTAIRVNADKKEVRIIDYSGRTIQYVGIPWKAELIKLQK